MYVNMTSNNNTERTSPQPQPSNDPSRPAVASQRSASQDETGRPSSTRRKRSRSRPKPTSMSYDTVLSWGKSLTKLLKSKEGVKVFRKFLMQEHSEENILFWEATESYRSFCKRNPTLREKQRLAQDIYHQFIAETANAEVTLDSAAKQTISDRLAAPDSELFDQAQEQIFDSMDHDSYPRFLESQLYRNLLIQQIPPDDVYSWSTDFTKLMGNPTGRQLFKAYLARERATENVRFFEAVEQFKRLSLTDDLQDRAERIYRNFMSEESTNEINIESHIRKAINEALRGDGKSAVTPDLFKDAEKSIFKSMQNDSFDRFGSSPTYKEFVKKHSSLQTVDLMS